jgi:hypothetical protein
MAIKMKELQLEASSTAQWQSMRLAYIQLGFQALKKKKITTTCNNIKDSHTDSVE